MKRYLRYGVLAVLVVFMLSLAGCGGDKKPAAGDQKDQKVTLVFTNWVGAEEGTRDKLKDVIAQFEKENPNIKIDAKTIPVSDTIKQLTIMASAGNAPDVAQVQGDGVISLAISNFLEPVDSLIPENYMKVLPKNIYDSAGLLNGKHYAFPWTPNENGFWYNKKLMKEAGLDPAKPPRTMEELDKAVQQAKQKLPKDVVMLQFDTTLRTIGLFDQWPFMLNFNQGVPPVDGDKINVNTPGMIAYGEWLRKQVKDGNTLPGKKYGEFRPMAAQNRLLFGFDGSYLHGVMKAMNKALTDKDIFDTWGVTSIPAGANGKSYTADTNHCLVIFKSSKHKEAAAKFAEYLTNSNYALTKYNLPAGFVPMANDAAQRVPETVASPISKAFMSDVLPTTVPLPYGANYNKMSEIIMAAVQEIITTDKPVKAILDDAQTKLVQAYKK